MVISCSLVWQLRGDGVIDENKKMDYEFELYGGKTINYQNIYIKSLTIDEIRNVHGLSNILQLFNLATISRKKFKDVDENVSLFELVMFSELNELFIAFLHTFAEFDEIEFGEKTMALYLKSGDKIGILNKENFEEFLEVFRMAYCIETQTKDSDRDDIDDEMREMLLEFEEEEEKIRNAKGNQITLNSMIKAICCRHPSLNCLNIGDCTVYQLKCDLVRLYQIDANVYINTGVYTGNISSKDVKIDDYNWAKVLK